MPVDKGRVKFRYKLIYKTVGSLVPLVTPQVWIHDGQNKQER